MEKRGYIIYVASEATKFVIIYPPNLDVVYSPQIDRESVQITPKSVRFFHTHFTCKAKP